MSLLLPFHRDSWDAPTPRRGDPAIHLAASLLAAVADGDQHEMPSPPPPPPVPPVASTSTPGLSPLPPRVMTATSLPVAPTEESRLLPLVMDTLRVLHGCTETMWQNKENVVTLSEGLLQMRKILKDLDARLPASSSFRPIVAVSDVVDHKTEETNVGATMPVFSLNRHFAEFVEAAKETKKIEHKQRGKSKKLLTSQLNHMFPASRPGRAGGIKVIPPEVKVWTRRTWAEIKATRK